jgi:hypothetical protein
MRRNIGNLIKSLKSGVKVNTTYGVQKVPNPTASMLVFHKSHKGERYITLQAETSLLDNIMTTQEVELITTHIARQSCIKFEEAINSLGKYLDSAASMLVIILLPLPLIFANLYEEEGILYGIMLYVVIVGLVMLGSSLW